MRKFLASSLLRFHERRHIKKQYWNKRARFYAFTRPGAKRKSSRVTNSTVVRGNFYADPATGSQWFSLMAQLESPRTLPFLSIDRLARKKAVGRSALPVSSSRGVRQWATDYVGLACCLVDGTRKKYMRAEIQIRLVGKLGTALLRVHPKEHRCRDRGISETQWKFLEKLLLSLRKRSLTRPQSWVDCLEYVCATFISHMLMRNFFRLRDNIVLTLRSCVGTAFSASTNMNFVLRVHF